MEEARIGKMIPGAMVPLSIIRGLLWKGWGCLAIEGKNPRKKFGQTCRMIDIIMKV